MSYKDKTLYCIDCKKNYVFTVENQEYLASKGYPNEPVRCIPCRQARRNPHAQSENNVLTTRSSGYFK